MLPTKLNNYFQVPQAPNSLFYADTIFYLRNLNRVMDGLCSTAMRMPSAGTSVLV